MCSSTVVIPFIDNNEFRSMETIENFYQVKENLFDTLFEIENKSQDILMQNICLRNNKNYLIYIY